MAEKPKPRAATTVPLEEFVSAVCPGEMETLVHEQLRKVLPEHAYNKFDAWIGSVDDSDLKNLEHELACLREFALKLKDGCMTDAYLKDIRPYQEGIDEARAELTFHTLRNSQKAYEQRLSVEQMRAAEFARSHKLPKLPQCRSDI